MPISSAFPGFRLSVSGPRAIGAQQQFGQIVVALAVECGHLPYPLDPRINRIRVFAENAGSLLHIHVGVSEGAQGLDERPARFRVCGNKGGNPVRRRGLDIFSAAMNQ